MKLKMSEVLELAEGIRLLLERYENDPVISRRLVKNQKALRADIEAFEDARKKLIDRFGKKSETGEIVPTADGKGIVLADPKAFSEEIKKLMDDETEISELLTVKISRLSKCVGAIISAISPIIEDDVTE